MTFEQIRIFERIISLYEEEVRLRNQRLPLSAVDLIVSGDHNLADARTAIAQAKLALMPKRGRA